MLAWEFEILNAFFGDPLFTKQLQVLSISKCCWWKTEEMLQKSSALNEYEVPLAIARQYAFTQSTYCQQRYVFEEGNWEPYMYHTSVFVICSPKHVRYIKLYLSEKKTHYEKCPLYLIYNRIGMKVSIKNVSKSEQFLLVVKKSEVRPSRLITLKDWDVNDKCEWKQPSHKCLEHPWDIAFSSLIGWKF